MLDVKILLQMVKTYNKNINHDDLNFSKKITDNEKCYQK